MNPSVYWPKDPYPYWPRDPYADSPMKRPPRSRTRSPLDPREPYATTFAQAPVHKPFPPTGSFDYRCGHFNGRSMTLKEERFEQFVNDMQARHDELSELREWNRQKDVELEAIKLWHELGGNLQDFSMQMISPDQEEMEIHCQRKNKKDKDLNPNAQRMIGYLSVVVYAMHQERIRIQAVEDLTAGAQASSHPLANMRIATNAAGLQQASQQSELTQSKPESHENTSQPISPAEVGSSKQQSELTQLKSEEYENTSQPISPAEVGSSRQQSELTQPKSEEYENTSQPISSAGVGSSKQQKQKTKLSVEEIRCQLKEQVQELLATTNQPISSAEPGSSRQQEQKQKTKLSPEEIRRQLEDQVQELLVTTSQPISSTEPGSSRQQEQKTKLSPEEIRSQFREQIQGLVAKTTVITTPSTTTTTTTTVRSVTPEIAASARETCADELGIAVPAAREDSFKAELAGHEPRVEIFHNVHYPKGAVLVKDGPSEQPSTRPSPEAEQILSHNIDQGSDTLQEQTVTGSNEQPSTSPSPEAEQSLSPNIGQGSDTLQEHTVTGSSEQPSTSPSPEAEQSLSPNIGQGSDTLQEQTVTGSSEQPSTSTSSQQTSSEGSTPLSSVHSSPPTTPIATSPHEMPAENSTNDGQNEKTDNRNLLLELEFDNHLSVKSPTRWDKLRPSLRNDPLLRSVLCEHIEIQRRKTMALWKGKYKALWEEKYRNERSQDETVCSEGGTLQQEGKPDVELEGVSETALGNDEGE